MNLRPPIHVTTLEYDSYKEYIKNYEHSFELLTFIKQEKKKKERRRSGTTAQAEIIMIAHHQ